MLWSHWNDPQPQFTQGSYSMWFFGDLLLFVGKGYSGSVPPKMELHMSAKVPLSRGEPILYTGNVLGSPISTTLDHASPSYNAYLEVTTLARPVSDNFSKLWSPCGSLVQYWP